MADTVSEFMSDKNVKKYKHDLRDKISHAMVKMGILASVFTSCSRPLPVENVQETGDAVQTETVQQVKETPSSKKNMTPVTTYAVTEDGDTLCAYQAIPVNDEYYARLQKLVNNATKSETGRTVLKAISEQENPVCLDTTGRAVAGLFTYKTKTVFLNANCSDEHLQSTLIHEGRHAMQFENSGVGNRPYQYTLASNIMLSRLLEADATATQVKFAFEMAEKGDSTALEAVRGSSGQELPCLAYENAVENGASKETAMKNAMLAWYNDVPYVSRYDAGAIKTRDKYVEGMDARNMGDFFYREYDADKLLQDVCQWNGSRYAGTDGSILSSEQTAYLTRKTYAAVSESNAAFEAKADGWASADNSINRFYIFGKNQTFEREKAEQVKERPASFSKMTVGRTQGKIAKDKQTVQTVANVRRTQNR